MDRRHALSWMLAATAAPHAMAQSAPAAEAAAPGSPLKRIIDEQLTDVRSVVVLQGGRERFRHDRPGMSPDALHDLQSITKSVLALLVGIAQGQGLLSDLDTLVVRLLPALAEVNPSAQAQQLTVRHLLTMTAGFQARDRRWGDPKERPAFAFSRPFDADPGSRFRYDNPAAHLLAAAVAHVVGSELLPYARQHLFEPLGIQQVEWLADEQGHQRGDEGLKLRTADLARLGQLVLQAGRWDGQQRVPKAFLQAAATRHSAGGAPVGLPYGYLWWLPGDDGSMLASGFGEQLLWVAPAQDAVLAVTSDVSRDSTARGHAVTLVRQHLLPRLRSSAAPRTS